MNQLAQQLEGLYRAIDETYARVLELDRDYRERLNFVQHPEDMQGRAAALQQLKLATQSLENEYSALSVEEFYLRTNMAPARHTTNPPAGSAAFAGASYFRSYAPSAPGAPSFPGAPPSFA